MLFEPNKMAAILFGFRMVVSLGRFIYKHYFYLYIKRPRLMVLAAILFMDHSKTEPFENRTTSTIRNPNAFGIRAPTVV